MELPKRRSDSARLSSLDLEIQREYIGASQASQVKSGFIPARSDSFPQRLIGNADSVAYLDQKSQKYSPAAFKLLCSLPSIRFRKSAAA
jgi:hypothetical protein